MCDLPIRNKITDIIDYKLEFYNKNNIVYTVNNIQWKVIINSIIEATFKYIEENIDFDKQLKIYYEIEIEKRYDIFKKLKLNFNLQMLEFIDKIIKDYNSRINKYINHKTLHDIFIDNFIQENIQLTNVFAYHDISSLLDLINFSIYYDKMYKLKYVYYKYLGYNQTYYQINFNPTKSIDMINFLNKIKPYMDKEVHKEIYIKKEGERPNLYEFFMDNKINNIKSEIFLIIDHN